MTDLLYHDEFDELVLCCDKYIIYSRPDRNKSSTNQQLSQTSMNHHVEPLVALLDSSTHLDVNICG